MKKSQKTKKNIGDKNTYILKGTVTTGGVAVFGPSATVNLTQQIDATFVDIEKMFDTVFRYLDTREEDPDVGKKEINSTVENLYEESKKREQANPKKLERWTKYLAEIAPDVLDVMFASLTSPVTGFAEIFKKVVGRAIQSKKTVN